MNVWLALSWGSDRHSPTAWDWFLSLKNEEPLYCRITQVGLLRLLTTSAVMGDDCLTVRRAWGVYDQWLRDPRVDFRREPPEMDELFRHASAPFSTKAAPKALGDCYLLAISQGLQARLVTFDGGLANLAEKASASPVLLT
jgi:toxin-antitoxin system PIN domain toxin